jgi:tetratricopeptide (TPR) repeat protein
MRLLRAAGAAFLLWSCAVSASANAPPDFDRLWDYGNPAKTETAFRELLPQAREGGDRSYLAQLLSQIARAQGLQSRFEAAHRTLDEAEALLTPELKTARVRCLLERGRVRNSGKQEDRGRSLFLQAWEQAKAAGEDFHAVDAAHMLGIVCPPDEALEWNRKASEYAERAQDARARKWLGALYNNIGWTYFDKKDYPAALDYLRKALDWYTEQKAPKPIFIAKWSVAKVRRVLGQVPDALAVQEALREEMEKCGTPDGYVYEELGECLLALGKAEEAKPRFARAYELLSQDDYLVKNEAERLARLKKLGGG